MGGNASDYVNLLQLLRNLIRNYLEANLQTASFSEKLLHQMRELFADYGGDLAESISLDDAELHSAIRHIQKATHRYIKGKEETLEKHLKSVLQHLHANVGFINILTMHVNKLELAMQLNAERDLPITSEFVSLSMRKIERAQHAVDATFKSIKRELREVSYLLNAMRHDLTNLEHVKKSTLNKFERITNKLEKFNGLSAEDKMFIQVVMEKLQHEGKLDFADVKQLRQVVQHIDSPALTPAESIFLNSFLNQVVYEANQAQLDNRRVGVLNNILRRADGLTDAEKSAAQLCLHSLMVHLGDYHEDDVTLHFVCMLRDWEKNQIQLHKHLLHDVELREQLITDMRLLLRQQFPTDEVQSKAEDSISHSVYFARLHPNRRLRGITATAA